MAGLVPPCEYPRSLRGIHDLFNELSNTRTYSLNGPEPLADLQIAAWQYNHHTRLTAFEAQVLRDLDTLHLRLTLDRSRENSH